MKKSKALFLMGMCQRSGKAASGETAVEKAIKTGIASLVIIAENASDNTKKKFENMCRYREIPYYFYETKENIGQILGKGERSSLAILDDSFANGIRMHIRDEQEAER